jgi:nicotinamidase-related amidase
MTIRGLERGQRAALVISQVQRAQTSVELRSARDALAQVVEERHLVPTIAALAQAFRRSGHAVVHSHLRPRADWQGFRVNCAAAAAIRRADVICEGKPGTLPDPGLEPDPADFVVTRRTGLTSFHGTELDALLQSLRIETVVVTGVSTNLGVLGTVIEAVNRGYEVVVPTDCIAGHGESAEVLTTDLLPVLAAITEHRAVEAALGSAPGDIRAAQPGRATHGEMRP